MPESLSIEGLTGRLESFLKYFISLSPDTKFSILFILSVIVVIIVAAIIYSRNRAKLSSGFSQLFALTLMALGAVSVNFSFYLKEQSNGIYEFVFSETQIYKLFSADTLFITLGIGAIIVGIALFFAEYERRLSSLNKSIIGNIIFICLGISLALYPLAGYSEGILTLLCINAIAAMGVSLFTGFTGIFSLGHAAYMALGAYTAAILSVRHGIHWLPSVVAGGVMAMIIAWAIGVPTLRLVGDYYAIVSIGLGESIRLILENWQSLTRGARGFPGITTFTTRPVAVGFFIVMGLLMFNLLYSKHGREFKAVRDDMIAASMMGFNPPRIRVFALVISAFYCGVAGALLAGFTSFIQPAMFDMMKSTELTSVVVFGGLGSMSGTLIGTSVITLVTELFRPISQYRMFIYGLILVLVMVFRPEGILGNREAWEYFYKRKAAK